MSSAQSYRSTVMTCFLANFIGTIVLNITPIVFIALKVFYGLSYTQFGILLAVNFTTQIVSDVVFSYPIDKYGYRPFAILSPTLISVGYMIFAFSPTIFNNPFHGFLLGTILFSIGGGVLELLLNPIINGIPGEQKATLMSMLHSFYGWGQLCVVLITTLAIKIFGAENWQWIVFAWAMLPIINIVQFVTCILPPQVHEKDRQGSKFLSKQKAFYLIVAIIAFAGMAEVSMAMWASVFLERAIGFPKEVGDIAGMCVFAGTLATGRLLYGLFGSKYDIGKLMIIGAFLAIILYLITAISPIAIISLIACGLCGFATSLLWPGSVVLAGKNFPLAGTWLYAMLTAGGDIGASIAPYIIGVIADNASKYSFLQSLLNTLNISNEEFGLRTGICVAAIFPLITLFLLIYYRKISTKK